MLGIGQGILGIGAFKQRLPRHPLHHQRQRVLIHRRVALAPEIDLRRHVEGRALAAHHGLGLFHLARHAEVAQLVFAALVHEDIIRLDIPMQNVVARADRERVAQIPPQLQHVPDRHGWNAFRQRRQQPRLATHHQR